MGGPWNEGWGWSAKVPEVEGQLGEQEDSLWGHRLVGAEGDRAELQKGTCRFSGGQS